MKVDVIPVNDIRNYEDLYHLPEELVEIARRKFVSDFETTTRKDDCRVWSWGIMEVGKDESFKYGNNIESFMKWLEFRSVDIYFHNLKFDGEFIVYWLLKNGYQFSRESEPKTFNVLINNMNQWYAIDICYGYSKSGKKSHTKIMDSLKMLPYSVDRIGKAFDIGVEKIDVDPEFYERHRAVGHELTKEEIEYLKNDVHVMSRALDIQLNQGMNKMTAGSNALADLKREIGGSKKFVSQFPIISLELNEDIRQAYRGGFTWLNKRYKNKIINGGITFDVNSLYPSVMYNKLLPYGEPIYKEGKVRGTDEYPLFIQKMSFSFELKDGYIPTIQIKNHGMFKGNEYLETSHGDVVTQYLTNIDLELIKEHYDLYDVKYHYGYLFRGKIGMFNAYIEKWTNVKMNSEGAIYQLSKLMMNSVYGKFATNPNITGKYPVLDEDDSVRLKMQEEEEFRDPIYTPLGVFITSWARDITIRMAQLNYDRIIYCDTDSVHLEGKEVPEYLDGLIDDKKLGYWAFEGEFEKGKYLRQKAYIQVFEDNSLSVTCSGMPQRIKDKFTTGKVTEEQPFTFDDFKMGFTSMGKLVPKHVPGGIVLEDSRFTLHEGV